LAETLLFTLVSSEWRQRLYSRHLFKGVAVSLLLSFPVSVLLARPSGTLYPEVQQSTQTGASPAPAADKGAKDKDEKPATDKGAKPEALPQSALSPEERLTFIIGVEDELQISVWREPELSTIVVVRPDGMITLPLVNDVKAVGLKTEELQNILIDKLKNFVNEPQVTVIVRAIRSRKVYLVGEVGHQGTFPINGDMTALELLAAAGGVGPFAKADAIYILREQNGKKIRIPFHYKKAVAGKSENVTLQPGDVIVVP
jgi:polysaccharide export outer membrane protein